MPFLSTRQVREILGVSRPFVRKLIDAGELTAIKAGDARNSPVRIDEDSVNAYIERRRVKASA